MKERKAAKKKEKEEKEAAERALKDATKESESLVTSELAQTVENGETEEVTMGDETESDAPQVIE